MCQGHRCEHHLGDEHCQAWDDAVQHTLLGLQHTVGSVPPLPQFGDVRDFALAIQWPYLDIGLTQTVVVTPVMSPPSQLVGCVWVKDAVKICGIRLVSARHDACQLGTIGFSSHTMACRPHLAAILISALLMPTLLAASTPCFLNLWLTSPFDK